jgi:hypothetical protein
MGIVVIQRSAHQCARPRAVKSLTKETLALILAYPPAVFLFEVRATGFLHDSAKQALVVGGAEHDAAAALAVLRA